MRFDAGEGDTMMARNVRNCQWAPREARAVDAARSYRGAATRPRSQGV